MSHSSSAFNQLLTLAELRAYQAGQLSAAEQHRIERLLLENPLYADALEGLEAIQQAGSNLHRQTRGLHEALQERIHEAATPRRLMPLWVTSLVASVLLVLSVSFYLIYTVNPAGKSDQKATSPAATHAVHSHVEPGTVLLDVRDLGTTATAAIAPKSLHVAAPTRRLKQKTGHRSMAYSRLQPMPMGLQGGTTVSATTLPVEPHFTATPTEVAQATLRARTINPERAFADWPPAVKL